MQTVIRLRWLWLGLLLTACAVLTETPPAPVVMSPSRPRATLTPFLSPTASRAATATPTSRPTFTSQPPATPIAPIATAPMLRFGGWSPDGETLAYWTLTLEEVSVFWGGNPPGALHFFNTRTDQRCDYPEQVDTFVWEGDEQVTVFNADHAKRGTPCGDDFTPTTATRPASSGTADVSPDGKYRAKSVIRETTNGVHYLVTTFSDVVRGEAVQTVEWRIDERLGDYADFLGGEWLIEDQFLIYETLDDGPLLVTVGKAVEPLGPTLFGRQTEEHCESGWCGNHWYASGARLAGTDDYHVTLSEPDGIWLYHSETGQTEPLPYGVAWGDFSPDGRWVLMDARPIVKGYETYTIHLRSVDPLGSETRFFFGGIAFHSPYPVWAADWKRVAVNEPQGRLVLLSFPAGEGLEAWQSEDYEVIPLAWSPDERWLAVHGYTSGQYREALFVVPVLP